MSIWKCIYTFQYKPSKLVHGNKQFLAVRIFKIYDCSNSKYFKEVENFWSQYS
jgi:hypothetical protein